MLPTFQFSKVLDQRYLKKLMIEFSLKSEDRYGSNYSCFRGPGGM
jgi:hypothetical protein